AEAARIMHQVQEGIERPKPSVSFEVGEQVRVSEGPFASFNGVVEEGDDGRSRLKVAVSIFGRPTRVERGMGQVEKLYRPKGPRKTGRVKRRSGRRAKEWGASVGGDGGRQPSKSVPRTLKRPSAANDRS